MQTRRSFLKHLCATSAAALPRGPNPLLSSLSGPSSSLPEEYFRRLSHWCDVVRRHLRDHPRAGLAELESQHGWYHFPYTVLPAALLYSRPNRANPWHGRQEMLDLALQIGDLLVREDEAQTFSPRLDSYRDVCLWLHAFGLIKEKLGTARYTAWRNTLARNVALLVPELRAWKDVAAYTENFLGTSPNHFAWWAATVLTGGVQLGNTGWVELGEYVLRRFATTEQNPDGYWGEHNPNSPTGGYNYLTTLAVGLYWEHTRDARALEALHRATAFHAATTYSDGNLIELFNDRNRYWEVSPWGQFAFSHSPLGRGYAQLLTRNIPDDVIDLDTLGMLAQDALFYHEGPIGPCPPERRSYVYRIAAPAGVRKSGPWCAALCGIVDTPLPRSQWFLDRQANLSIFHERCGLIVSGANSKHQPELGTFSEKISGTWESAPRGGRLEQSTDGDTLAIAHNSFSAEIFLPPVAPAAQTMEVQFRVNGRGPAPEQAFLGLQLCLRPGTELHTGTGRSTVLSAEKIAWSAADIGGELRHGNWTLRIDGDAALEWPVFPYNPYRNGPETKLEHAVGLLRVPLGLKADPARWLQVNERTIRMRISVPGQD